MMKKVDHVILFCEKMLDFEKRYPESFSIEIFKKIPSAIYKTPFDRDDKLNNLCVQEMRERFGKAIMKKVYLLDWDFVKVISYDAFFIEQLNMVDSEYDTIYNILGDDTLYSEFMVPVFMIKYKRQRHLYLKKQHESI